MDRGVLAVVNPTAGSSDQPVLAEVRKCLEASGRPFQIVETEPNVAAEQLVRQGVEEGFRDVMVCGGDGTVMSAINGVCRSDEDVRLSIVPAGTANLVATALEIPMDVPEAIDVGLHGDLRRIDVGYCEGHYFALGIGVGLTERLVSQASAEWKESIGRWAYAAAVLGELRATPHRFLIDLDGEAKTIERGVAVVIANTGDLGHGMHFAPSAKLDDGLLDVCILHSFGLRDLFRLLANSLRGRLAEDRALSFMKAKKVRLEIKPPLDVQIDGEVVDLQTPFEASAVPGRLVVRVPRAESPEDRR